MNWRLLLLIAAIILFAVAGADALGWIDTNYAACLAFGLACGAGSRLP